MSLWLSPAKYNETAELLWFPSKWQKLHHSHNLGEWLSRLYHHHPFYMSISTKRLLSGCTIIVIRTTSSKRRADWWVVDDGKEKLLRRYIDRIEGAEGVVGNNVALACP